jgi:hypothetical protein
MQLAKPAPSYIANGSALTIGHVRIARSSARKISGRLIEQLVAQGRARRRSEARGSKRRATGIGDQRQLELPLFGDRLRVW